MDPKPGQAYGIPIYHPRGWLLPLRYVHMYVFISQQSRKPRKLVAAGASYAQCPSRLSLASFLESLVSSKQVTSAPRTMQVSFYRKFQRRFRTLDDGPFDRLGPKSSSGLH